MTRIYTAADLDNLMGQEEPVVVSVDAPSGYIESAVLVAVYNDGRFEVVFDRDGETHENLYTLADVKVFA